MIRLSVTSKLDGIRSWSLQALDTCAGSIGPDGELVDACKGCYATTGNYNYPNVKAPRLENKLDWERTDWVQDMVQALSVDSYFRWFDSGDMYSVKLAKKIFTVMQQTPWVKHWMPTRMHKFAKFLPIIEKMQALPNVVVRFSSDSVCGQTIPGANTSVIFSEFSQLKGTKAKVCKAYEHEGKCSGCRNCWKKSVTIIAYPAHGKKMHKVISLKLVA